MSQPLVSVVLCVYNGERFLADTVRSVLGQTYPNLELIVVDDASADRTEEIIRSFRDERITLLRNAENRHISFSTNRGIAAARGEYIAIIDSDDRWLPEKAARQVEWLEAHPEDGCCFTWATVVDENDMPWAEGEEPLSAVFRQGNRSRKQWLRDLVLDGNCFCHPSVMYRKSDLEKAGGYDETLSQLLDYEVYLRLLKHAGIHIIEEPLVLYRRVREQNTSNSAQGSGAVSAAADQRLWNETGMILTDTVREMPEEEFMDIFGDILYFNPPRKELALFEKGWLLYHRYKEGGIRREGLSMIRKCLQDPEKGKLVREQAVLSGKTFFEWETFQDERMRLSENHILDLEKLMQEAEKDKDYLKGEIDRITGEYRDTTGKMNKTIQDLNGIIQGRDQEIARLNGSIAEIRASFFYRLMNPARRFTGMLKRGLRKHPKAMMAAKGVKSLLTLGPKATLDRMKIRKVKQAQLTAVNRRCDLTEEERKQQEAVRFPMDITYSILVPLYNTPEKYLTAMIDSAVNQTYARWELCLADGSDAEHAYVGEICQKRAKKDPRIRYQKLEKNMGISGNTNACIEMSKGNYIALFDHDDLLHPAALYEVTKAICERNADFVYTDENTFHETPEDAYQPHFKPDYAPDTLRANNYICHLTVFKKDLLEKAGGGFRSEFDGSQDFDLVLRLTEQAKHIVHIPKVLYYWRAHKNSVAESVSAKPYVIEAAKKAISQHLERVGLEGEVLDSVVPSMYRLKYKIHGEPLISILIPNMDHSADLRRCVESILNLSTYGNYEIIIIENNSTESETFAYYEELEKDSRIRVVTWDGPFNFSAINNFGFRHAKGDHILLLNNDTEVIAPDWLQEMLMYSQRSDVGAVGAKLYYPDHTIQHAGLGIGLLTLAGHYHRHFDGNHPGYMGRLIYAQDLSGVTAACMMIPRHVYEEMEGLDETFEVAFNDVDLCMRIRKAGYLIVFTPFAELWHYESKSRGLDEAPEKRARFVGEVTRFQKRWARELAAGDPYYNPNFSLDKEDFSIREA